MVGRGSRFRGVEVSTDGGRTWKDAQLHDPIARKAHTRFTIPWNWNGEEAMLLSRCTDDQGVVQPSLAEVAKIWGTDVDFFRNSTLITSDLNAIQHCKVNRDGERRKMRFTKLLCCRRGARRVHHFRASNTVPAYKDVGTPADAAGNSGQRTISIEPAKAKVSPQAAAPPRGARSYLPINARCATGPTRRVGKSARRS